MYFYLNEKTFLVLGIRNSCIYDMENKKLYALDKESTECLKISENGGEIDDLYEKVTIFKDLEKENLGFVSSKKCFIDKIRLLNNSTAKRKDLNFPICENAIIKLNNKCAAKCKVCNTVFCPICLCNEEKLHNDELSADSWISIISKISRVGLKQITFTGGDALNYDQIYKLIDFAHSLNLEVNLVINGLSAIDEHLDATINIILVAYEERDYSSIIKKLKHFKSILIQCSDTKVKEHFETIIKEEKVDNAYISLVNITQKPMTKNLLTYFDIYTYGVKRDFDICLLGKIYIDYQGNVVPCLQKIQTIIGNIANDDFNVLMNDLIDDYWNNPLYENKCGKCEYKYACQNCKMYDADINCRYDQLKGEWLE